MNICLKISASILLIFLSACISTKENNKGNLYCYLGSASQEPLSTSPDNANSYRQFARRAPNDPNSFGPPPAQQKYSGKAWDKSNEYWYIANTGELFLYSNTDDFYVYYWQFSNTSKIDLVNHGLIDCGIK